MQPNGSGKASPRRTYFEHQMRLMLKQISKPSWLKLATTGTDVAQARQLSLTETRDCAAMEPNTNANHSNERAHSHAIDKSALALPEPRRVRDRDHIRSIIQKPCLVCGRRPSDPHHLRFAQSRALSSKVSDQFTVPLCRGHHRELHRCGDEAAWWRRQKIDALGVARLLWLESHPLAEDHEVNSTDIVDITGDPTGSLAQRSSVGVWCLSGARDLLVHLRWRNAKC